ncbi:hypothetical protein JB92DRAFT_2907667 [Gautieria morchelliformis]|nr:hypothetical protein JB92DRAFT_2907667 [Gautieria morchelliformis]
MWGSFPPIQEAFCQQGLPSILGVADSEHATGRLSGAARRRQRGQHRATLRAHAARVAPLPPGAPQQRHRARADERVSGHHGGERGQKEIEVFKRKWIYYYCYCGVGFTTRTLGDHIVTFTREGNTAYGCNVYD